MTAKDRYRQFCKEEKNLPIFLQDWWLDAVCINGEWDVALYEKEGRILAVWPYYLTKKWGIKQIVMPKQTKFMGPWWPQKSHKNLILAQQWEKDAIFQLHTQIPSVARITQNLFYHIQLWTPFHFLGFKETCHYSYRFDAPIDLEGVKNGMSNRFKNLLQRAEEQWIVQDSEDLGLLKKVLQFNVDKNKIQQLFPDVLISTIFKETQQRKVGRFLVAQAPGGETIGGIYLIKDGANVYYLLSGLHPAYSNSGAVLLLLWHGIQWAHKEGLSFDFEGSMIEGIAQFFRSFGAIPKPYHIVSKTYPLWFRMLEVI